MIFETIYGKIEIDTNKSEAYFFKDDYIAFIDGYGQFKDLWGREFKFVGYLSEEMTLSVLEWRTIGVVKK